MRNFHHSTNQYMYRLTNSADGVEYCSKLQWLFFAFVVRRLRLARTPRRPRIPDDLNPARPRRRFSFTSY